MTKRRPPVNKTITNALTTTPEAKSVEISFINKSEGLKLGLFEGGKGRQLFQWKKNGVTFSIGSRLNVLPEVQACRLVQYLCSFDPRVKPLLTVIRYWAEVNDIRLAKPGGGRFNPPDTAVLDWLVIFFLCHKKKMIPTPRQVQERPHRKLLVNDIDIGFCADPSFVQEFKQDPCMEVGGAVAQAFNIFNLAKQFFEFYSHNKKLVLNMMDGEIIPMEQFVGDINTMETKLSEQERQWARKMHRGNNPGHLILLHPLNLNLKRGFACFDRNYVDSVVPVMKVTRDKLETAFNKYSRKKDKSELDFRSTLTVN